MDASRRVTPLDFSLFRHLKGVVHLDPEVPDRALQLRVPKQELHGSQIPRASLARVVLQLEADADAPDLRELQRWLRADQVRFVPRAMPGRVVRLRGSDGHGSVSPVQVGRLSIDHDDLGRLTDQA